MLFLGPVGILNHSCYTGKEMDLRSSVKNGILYLQDPVDKEWNPHFFVLTNSKLFYTDRFHENPSRDTEEEEEGEEETETSSTQRHREVSRAWVRNS